MVESFQLLIISSPSGAGKTTLTRRLLERLGDLHFSVSHTTRSPRVGEQDGKDYHFISRDTFLDMIKADAFVEWAEVHGNLYGTARSEIEMATAKTGCRGILFDIDYQGARQIRAKLPEVVGIFILPPSMAELEKRLRGRASETEEVVQRRFNVARREIEHYALFDYVVVNDEIERAFDKIRAIILAERSTRRTNAHLAEALLRTGSLPKENLL